MTFSTTIDAADLTDIAAQAAAIVPGKANIPIIDHALLTASAENLVVAATDLDQSISLMVATKGKSNGAVAVPAARLAAAAARLDQRQGVKLSAANARLTLSQGRTIYHLPTMDPAEFPDMLTSPLTGATLWQCPSAPLIVALKALDGAINRSDPRFYLAGVCFDLTQDDAAIVGTDGIALGVVRIDDLAPPTTLPPFILPAQFFRPLIALAAGADAIALAITDRAITAEAAGQRLYSKLIDGSYPPWRRAVPPPAPWRVTVDSAAMTTLVSRVGIIEGNRIDGVKGVRAAPWVTLDFSADEIAATSRNNVGDEASDVCAAQIEGQPGAAGAPPAVKIESRRLAWAAASLAPAERIEIGIAGPHDPVTFIRSGDNDRRDLRLVCTIR